MENKTEEMNVSGESGKRMSSSDMWEPKCESVLEKDKSKTLKKICALCVVTKRRIMRRGKCGFSAMHVCNG